MLEETVRQVKPNDLSNNSEEILVFLNAHGYAEDITRIWAMGLVVDDNKNPDPEKRPEPMSTATKSGIGQ